MNDDIKSVCIQVMDATNESCFIYNLNKKCFEYVNIAFEFLTQINQEEIINNPMMLIELVHVDDIRLLTNNFKRLLKSKKSKIVTFRIKINQIEKWIRLKMHPVIKVGDDKYILGVANDDSDLRDSIKHIKKLDGRNDLNLEALSHDLRGPNGTIQMLASIIAKKSPDHKEIQKLTSMIIDLAKENLLLLQKLLTK
jgi:hypothetical protein